MTVPPARQCTLPDCDREAVDPGHPGALCEFHHDGGGAGEPVTETESSACQERETGSSVPEPLTGLGEVFVPIPPRQKFPNRPRTPENLYTSDDPVLEAYLEAGHNYGLVCRGDLAYLDVDDPDALADLVDAIPATAWQVTGSRSGEHYFLRVPGLDEDIPLDDPETGENLGHVKAAGQSLVVGPGSLHPSGNRYGPLQGDRLATVAEDDLHDLIEPYRPAGAAASDDDAPTPQRGGSSATCGDTPLDVGDVLTGYTEGVRTEHPFHGSDTGANFMVDEDGETFRCWRHDCTGNALHLVGIEQGIIDCGEWTPGGLDTDTWREIFAAAREAEYDLPEFDPGDDVAHTAVLPPAVRDLTTAASGWDWRHAGLEPTLSIDDARERTTQAISDAYQSGDRVLVEALPTMGKSYGAVKAATETGEPITILTGRGRNEQYEQFREWCDEHGLTHRTLPAFTRDCTTANGEHGAEWKATVRSWYRRGATPQAIHKWAEDVLGRPLPCQEHEGQCCPYAAKWDFDPETDGSAAPEEDVPIDVLIGHYAHAHKSKVTAGRTVVFDEFADAYETRLGDGLQGAVSYWLSTVDEVPFADYTDLLEHRDDEQRRSDALAWFLDEDLAPDETQVFDDDSAHAAAPLAVFTLLASEDLGNGFETAALDDVGTGVHHRESGQVSLLRPPDLEYARGVVALDGTPTQEMWELALGERLNHRPVLQEEERAAYVEEALNLNVVRTTDAVKPYNNADHVAETQDADLLEEIADVHGEAPAVITSATAVKQYDSEGVLDVDLASGGVEAGPAPG